MVRNEFSPAPTVTFKLVTVWFAVYDSLICLLGKNNVDTVESEYALQEINAVFHKVPKLYSMKRIGVVALNGGGRIYFLRSNHY